MLKSRKKQGSDKKSEEQLAGSDQSDQTGGLSGSLISSEDVTTQPAPIDRLAVRAPRHRTPGDRGLPSNESLRALGTTYLENQRRLWPEHAESGLLPAPSDATLDAFIEDFENRFRTDQPFDMAAMPKKDDLAASYSRFSDEGSNHRSLAQQLRLQLERARANDHFIPWSFVFADAAVTGTTSKRRGYELAKSCLALTEQSPKALYIDEIGRASRDMIEALTLGKLVTDLNKRLIGASDGFDSDQPMSKIQLSIFAALQEWFIDQLRAKVKRGMDDAFSIDANTGLPAPGYTLIPLFDSARRPVFGKDGIQCRTLAIDEEQSPIIHEIFVRYAVNRQSPDSIAEWLNEIKFSGSQTWDGGRVRTLLRRHKYVGISTYRMTRQVRDRTTGKVTVIKRPRGEWSVRRARHLQIIEFSLWKLTQKLLGESAAAFTRRRAGGVSRTDIRPTKLIRPICDKCESTMVLGSSGKYPSYKCPNGERGKHGCTARGYKSVAMVEKSILRAMEAYVFGPNTVDTLVSAANQYLKEMAAMPRTDTAPIRAEISRIKKQIGRLYRLVEDTDDGDGAGDCGQSDFAGARERIRAHERELKRLNSKLQTAKAQNSPPPAAVTKEEVEEYLKDLRGLLNQDVGRAATVLKDLIGTVRVCQTKNEGKPGYTWVAKFQVNLVNVFATIEATKDHPTSGVWEYLHTRGWMKAEAMEVTVEEGPKPYEALVPKVRTLLEKSVDLSAAMIAAKLQISVAHATKLMRYCETGVWPTWPAKPRGNHSSKNLGRQRAKDIVQEVLERHDIQRHSFSQIARDLGVCDSTARQAYDLGHPELIQAALETGDPVKRGKRSRLSQTSQARIIQMIRDGARVADVVRVTGCSSETVYRMRKRIGGL